jgi:hypothetical protein
VTSPPSGEERRRLLDSLAEIRELEAWYRAAAANPAPHEDVQVIQDDADRYRRVVRHLERLTRPG